MSAAARSLFVFGVYAILAGLGLALLPDVVLRLLRFPPAGDGWVRVVGVLASVVGIYHVLAARHELLPYIRATVAVRVAFALGVAGLVAASLMPMPLLLFGAIDVLGAIWTALALRSQAARVTAPPSNEALSARALG